MYSVDAAAVNPNGIKILLPNVWGTFLISYKPGFSNSPRCLPRSPSECAISDNWVFDDFLLADELFGKVLKSFENCVH